VTNPPQLKLAVLTSHEAPRGMTLVAPCQNCSEASEGRGLMAGSGQEDRVAVCNGRLIRRLRQPAENVFGNLVA
jgi:hypothetical protein